MDIETAWRPKRQLEDEEYKASKRHLPEKFFNMNISAQPQAATEIFSDQLLFQAAPRGTAVGTSNPFGIEDNIVMTDTDAGTSTLLDSKRMLSANSASPSNNNGHASDDDDNDYDDVDLSGHSSAPFLSRRDKTKTPPHPFLRQSSSSTVDGKLEDWVRMSRNRLVADASLANGAAPDRCRALILYKPLPFSEGLGDNKEGTGSVKNGDGGGGEGGGDPTPSPQTSGSGGDETETGCGSGGDTTTTAARARESSTKNKQQWAGIGTAEATTPGVGPATVNGVGKGKNGLFGAAVGPFGSKPLGTCSSSISARERGDDGGSGALSLSVPDSLPMSHVEGNGEQQQALGVTEDAMELDTAVEENCGGDLLEDWNLPLPVLTRVGTSRGLPTPELTPELAANARRPTSKRLAQDAGEPAETKPSLAPLFPEGRIR